MDAMVQDIWDSARKITCDWQSKLEKVITFSPFGVADLKQVKLTTIYFKSKNLLKFSFNNKLNLNKDSMFSINV